MTTITVQDIALHRELLGKIWCESKGHMDGNFNTMNLQKISDSPERYEFTTWTCGCQKPTQEELLTITVASLDLMIARYQPVL